MSAATAYDDPITNTTYILVVNEGLYYGSKLSHSLFNPNQLRAHGIKYWDNPFDTRHSLTINIPDTLTIPLQTRGTKILFDTRSPTAHELETCPHIELTGAEPWNPTTVQLSSTTQVSKLGDNDTCHSDTTHALSDDSDALYLRQISNALVNMKVQLVDKVNINASTKHITIGETYTEDIPARRTFTSTERHTRITADILAERFCIGPTRAKATIRATMQRGLRSAILLLGR